MASISDQNWVVWNQGKNPLVNFNFMLRVELMFDLPCKSVRAFSRELEYDYIQEGGLNDYVHMRRKPITKPFTLEVERYVGVDYLDPLPLGADLTLPVLLFVARNHDQFIPGVVARTYVFTGCTVMKKTYGDLVADQSGLLVETTTIGYREMLCVDIPWSEVGNDIPKDIKNGPKPTESITQKKSGEELKAIAQNLYEEAKRAKERADTEFKADELTALLKELEDAIEKLNKLTGKDGELGKAADAAEKELMGEGGKTKDAIADERKAAARAARKTRDEKLDARLAADRAYKEAQRETEALKKEIEEEKNRPLASEEEAAAEQEIAAENEPSAPMQEKTAEEREKTLQAMSEQLAALQEKEKAAEQTAEKAEKERAAAEAALRAAEEAAEIANKDALAARHAAETANAALERGKKQLNLLQNSKTNLTLRQDRTVQAQKDCTTQHESCKKSNDEVQKLDSSRVQEINSGCEDVRKQSKQACMHERQVRETGQYMDTARKLLADAKPLLAGQSE